MQNLGVILRTFWEKAVSYLTLQMSLTDIIEIIIIFSADLLYAGLDQRYESVDASPWNPCDPCLCFACSFV